MNVNDLKMRDLRDLQRAMGVPADEFAADAFGLAAGMAWLVKRKDDPSFTFEQALDLTQEETLAITGDLSQ